MKISIAGMVTQVVILFLGIVILPIYYMSIIQYYKDVNRIMVAERNLIDYVIDNKQVADSALSEFNITTAAVSTSVDVTITRETRIIDPSDDSPSKVDVKWVAVDWDKDTVWLQGDLITVNVKQDSSNIMQQISGIFLGSMYSNLDMPMTGMVR